MSIFENKIQDIEVELAKILGCVSHHIHPEIVLKIVEKNKEFKDRFSSFCHPKIDLDDYFYEGSDCIFPAVRRHINSEKGVEKWKNNINDADGNIINDNTYPRHIWTFLTDEKVYSGGVNGSWLASGLSSFELAHIFAHKIEERDLEKKAYGNFNEKSKPYALFTSASNVILIPKGLAKPTDRLESIKKVFYQRHQDLYGDFVRIPGIENLLKESVPEWYKEIKWNFPVLPKNWEANIEKLLQFREKHLRTKYTK